MISKENAISPQVLTAFVLLSGLATIVYFAMSGSFLPIILVALLPCATLIFITSIKHPIIALLSYGSIAIFWGTIYRILIRYSGISALLDGAIIFFVICMLFHAFTINRFNWRRAINIMTFSYAIWFLYTFMEVLNPTGLIDAWINARGFLPITLVFVALISVVLSTKKAIKTLVVFVAIITIIAFIKLLIQKYIGWDDYERTWLYSSDSYRTHLLVTGIRYFSIFSDAGNFGSNMGSIALVYAIIALYTPSYKWRIFYFIVSAMGIVGLFMSGTRGALIVPLGGLILFCLIIKNIKLTIAGGILGILIYTFFAFTTIGESNQFIRRMRTAFRPTEDASFNVRIENQKKIAAYLKDKPFGEGIGLAGVEAQKYGVRYITTIPVDSYYVKIWVQTGIVGLILHITMLLTMLLWGCYLIMFKIRNKELQGTLAAMACGLFGLMLSAYGNQFFGQPNTQFILFTYMACILNGPYIDKQITIEKEKKEQNLLTHKQPQTI